MFTRSSVVLVARVGPEQPYFLRPINPQRTDVQYPHLVPNLAFNGLVLRVASFFRDDCLVKIFITDL